MEINRDLLGEGGLVKTKRENRSLLTGYKEEEGRNLFVKTLMDSGREGEA